MATAKSISRFNEYLDSVNSQLSLLYPKDPTNDLERAVRDSLSGGGKRVRAILSLLWCEMYSGDYRPALPIAAAYELAHASALVQDDIIDNSGLRRNNPSIVAKYGLSKAILASDLLLFHVPKMVAVYGNLGSRKLAKLFDLVGDACRATTWGEFLDLELARKGDVTEVEYENMIKLKTSTLLSAPSASGAIVGGASDEEVSKADRYGEMLGMAYQVRDDTLDLIGDESVLGKPAFSDIAGGKQGLALIHCMTRCTDDEKNFVRSLMDRRGPFTRNEVSSLRRLLNEHGSIDYCHQRAQHYADLAKRAVSDLPDRHAKSLLVELADYLVERYY